MKVSAAFEKVFGAANLLATSRKANESGVHQVMRVGKTARDKAKGHQPYKKNRRVWDDKAGWVKV